MKEEAAPAAIDDGDKIEAAAVSSEEEAKEETPDPESTKTKGSQLISHSYENIILLWYSKAKTMMLYCV